LKKTLKLDWLQLWPEESRKRKIRLERSRKRDGGNFNPDRAQNSDSDTSQRQKSNTAEKDYGEKSNSASAQEAPVYIHSKKLTNAVGPKVPTLQPRIPLIVILFSRDRIRFGLKLRLPISLGRT